MVPTFNAAKSTQIAFAKNLAMSYYQDTYKAERASEAYGHAVDFSRNMPIGCSFQDRNNFQPKLEAYVRQQMKPKGFILGITLGWLILAMLSGVISWAVQLFMKNNFEKK